MNVTPLIVRHLNALPLRMPYWLTLRLMRLASPLLAAGMVTVSPADMSPIGYVIGRLIRNSRLELMS
jgi:hypothetical protein